MNDPIEQIVEDFFANLQTSSQAGAMAERLQADGHTAAARMFRAVAVCEKVRVERFRKGMPHHIHENVDYFVCPHCGLIYIPQPPERCAVDDTPAADFIQIE